MKKEKLTFAELRSLIHTHNELNHVESQWQDKKPLICVVVFKAENWEKKYSLKARSYQFRSDEKYFLPAMGGNSWYGVCLDNTREVVRIDWVDWEIDYCYIK